MAVRMQLLNYRVSWLHFGYGFKVTIKIQG